MIRRIQECLARSPILIIIFLCSSGCVRTPPDTIAVVGDTSGSSSALGQSIEFGARYAMFRMPKSATTSRLQLLTKDDRGDVAEAERIAFLLATDPSILAVIGHSASGTTEVALKIYAQYEMPVLMPVATSPLVATGTTAHRPSVAFRLVPTDDLQAFRLADFARRHLSSSTAVVVHDQTLYGAELGRSLTRALREQGVEITVSLPIESRGDTTVYRNVVDAVKALQPETLAFAGYYAECAAIVRQIRAAGFRRPVLLTDGCYQTEFLQKLGARMGPLFIAFVAPNWSRIPRAAHLREEFRRKYPDRDPSYAPFASDSVLLIAAAAAVIEKQDRRLTRRTLAEALRTGDIDDIGPLGIMSPYRFDPAGNNTRGKNYIFEIIESRQGVYTFNQLQGQ